MESGLHIILAQPYITEVAGFPITPTLVTSWLTVAVLLITAFFVGRSLKLKPGKIQVVFEGLIKGVYDYVREVLESDTSAKRFFPLVMTIFLFILMGNWLGLTPIMEAIGFETIGEHGEHGWLPLLYPQNADLNIPLALAIISFLTIEISGILYLGILTYGSKFVNIRSPMDFFVGLLEIIGNLARLVSLSFRLFGNILAGHILIIVVLFFVPYLLPLPFMAFELFVGFMQAAIFALLTLIFIKIAIEEPHEQH